MVRGYNLGMIHGVWQMQARRYTHAVSVGEEGPYKGSTSFPKAACHWYSLTKWLSRHFGLYAQGIKGALKVLKAMPKALKEH